jgi:S-DNA-T family DNA segregation ATPase FtsK/SpoIIIE
MRHIVAQGRWILVDNLILIDGELWFMKHRHQIKHQPSNSTSNLIARLSNKVGVRKRKQLVKTSLLLETSLMNCSISANVVNIISGPIVTRFQITTASGTEASELFKQCAEIARSMHVLSLSVVELSSAAGSFGIDIPNKEPVRINMSDIVNTEVFQTSSSTLTLALGCDHAGNPVVIDLDKTPHLLMGGARGQGKSVTLHGMLTSLLQKVSPDRVKLLLIDTSMVELPAYDSAPHLLTPVITEANKAIQALQWCEMEIERRVSAFKSFGVHSIVGYNVCSGEKLPFVVVVVDEFAHLRAVDEKLDQRISSIAKKGQMVGIHLILTTQYPTEDVITRSIKLSIPARIAFRVTNEQSSITILGQSGAEQLLGHGDMLYSFPGSSALERIHGAFVSDDEVNRIVKQSAGLGVPRFIPFVDNQDFGAQSAPT